MRSSRPPSGPRPSHPRSDQRTDQRSEQRGPRQDRPQGKPQGQGPNARAQSSQAQPSRPPSPTRLELPRGEAPRAHQTHTGGHWIYGLHAVAAALKNPSRRIRRLVVTEEGAAALASHVPPPWAIGPESVEREKIDRLVGRDAVHQGLALLADPLPSPSLETVVARSGPILVLDQVTDPRNVGAILRSAAAFNAAAVVLQERNAPEETGALAKAASGALEIVPILRAVNLTRTIVALKAHGFWCVGLDARAKPLIGVEFRQRRVALVLGAEGEGLRRLTKDTCDELAALAMAGNMESLNVSAAATVALYELARGK